MSDAAPPPWVKALAHLDARGRSDSGTWRVLVGLWGWGPFRDAEGAPLAQAPRVAASAARIATKLGMKKAAVAKQLRKLADEGWIRRDDDGLMTLAAWGRPHVFELEAEAGGSWAAPTLPPQDPVTESHRVTPPQDPSPTGSPPVPPQDPTLTPQGQGVPPQGYQSSSSCSSSSENVGDAPAPATPQPSVNGAPVGETPERLPSLCTHPPCRNRMVPSPLGTAKLHDCRRCHDLAAAAANEHLGSKLAAHRARLQAEPPKASRVELTQAVHEAVVYARMSSQLAGPRWSEWMLEALDDIGVPKLEHAGTVARVLASWHEQHPSSKPPKSNIWARRNRAWQRKAMGLGLAKPTGQDNMSGGIVAGRPLPDWDAQDAARGAST